jgi:uncharacterized protein YndB with AHSA1/START domain
MYKASIEIEAAPGKIFEYLTDPKHVKSWQPDVVEPRPLPPGGLHVGAHVGAIVQEYGRRFDVDLLVAAMTRNEHIAYRMEAPTASAYVEYRLVQWGRYTRVVNTTAMHPKGFLASLMTGVIDKIAQWKMESRLKLLRTAVESHA